MSHPDPPHPVCINTRGRPLSPAARDAVTIFARFLSNEVAYDTVNHRYVPAGQANGTTILLAGHPQHAHDNTQEQ